MIPQFGLLFHVSSLRSSSGHSGLGLTLRTYHATHTFLSSLPSLVVDASIWATSPLADAVRHIFCGFCFFFLPVALHSEIPKLLTFLPVREFPTVWKVLLHNSLPRTGLLPLSPNSYLNLFAFYILSHHLLKEWAAFLGAWCPPPAFRSYFLEVAQHSNDLLMNLSGRKWSPHAIPPPSWGCPSFSAF